MASTNFKLFDENKTNMMSDTEYNINTQRLNGVQAGIASSQLQNKTLHQTSLVAYSLAQIMMQNGYDANDSAAVSAFVGNMSNSLLQKVLDKATFAEAQAGTITNKWISPATMKAAALLLSGGTMSGPINMGNNKITNLDDPTNSLDSANKKYVDENSSFKKIKVVNNKNITISSGVIHTENFSLPSGFDKSYFGRIKFIEYEIRNFTSTGNNTIVVFSNNQTGKYIYVNGTNQMGTASFLLSADFYGNEESLNSYSYSYQINSKTCVYLSVNRNTGLFSTYLRASQGSATFNFDLYVLI